jgi:hypothetical protein
MAPKNTSNLNIRVAPDELERWNAAAQADGRTLSQWVRWHLNRAPGVEHPADQEERPERP